MAPLVRGLTGAAYSDVPRPSAHDTTTHVVHPDDPMSTSMTSETMTSEPMTSSAAEDELPEPGTTRNLLAKFQSFQAPTTQ